jgi:hypothetical protein
MNAAHGNDCPCATVARASEAKSPLQQATRVGVLGALLAVVLTGCTSHSAAANPAALGSSNPTASTSVAVSKSTPALSKVPSAPSATPTTSRTPTAIVTSQTGTTPTSPERTTSTTSAKATETATPTTSAKATETATPTTSAGVTTSIPPDPKATIGVPVVRNGTTPTPSISAPVEKFISPVTYPDGIAVTILSITEGVTTEQAPGSLTGRPSTLFKISFTNNSKAAIDLSQVVVTVTYGSQNLLATPLYNVASVADFSGTVAPGKSVATSYAFSIPKADLSDVRMAVDFDGLHAAATFDGSVQ